MKINDIEKASILLYFYNTKLYNKQKMEDKTNEKQRNNTNCTNYNDNHNANSFGNNYNYDNRRKWNNK